MQVLKQGCFPNTHCLRSPDNDGRHIYAGVGNYPEIPADTGAGSIISYFGVIKSPDGGKSWSWVLKSDYATNPANMETGWAERDYDLPWILKGPKGVGPIGLGISPVNPDICCFTDLSSTFLTIDGGAAWKQLYSNDHADGSASTRGMDVTTCYGVHFNPFDRNNIAISYTDIGVFHSKDGGRTWLHAMENVPAEWGNTCYWLIFDPDVKGKVWSAWGEAHDLPRPQDVQRGRISSLPGRSIKE